MGLSFSSIFLYSARVQGEPTPKKKLLHFPIQSLSLNELFMVLEKMEIMSYVRTLKSSKLVIDTVKKGKFKKRDMKESVVITMPDKWWHINIGWEYYPIFWTFANRRDPEEATKLMADGLCFFKFKQLVLSYRQPITREEEDMIGKYFNGLSDSLVLRHQSISFPLLMTLKPKKIEIAERNKTNMAQQMLEILDFGNDLKEFVYSGDYDEEEEKCQVRGIFPSLFPIIKDLTTNTEREDFPSLIISISGVKDLFKEMHLLGGETYNILQSVGIQVRLLPTTVAHRFVTVIYSLYSSRRLGDLEFIAVKSLSNWTTFKKFYFEVACYVFLTTNNDSGRAKTFNLLENSSIRSRFA